MKPLNNHDLEKYPEDGEEFLQEMLLQDGL